MPREEFLIGRFPPKSQTRDWNFETPQNYLDSVHMSRDFLELDWFHLIIFAQEKKREVKKNLPKVDK